MLKNENILHFYLILLCQNKNSDIYKNKDYLLLVWVDEGSPVVSRCRARPAKPCCRRPKRYTAFYLTLTRTPRWFRRSISTAYDK